MSNIMYVVVKLEDDGRGGCTTSLCKGFLDWKDAIRCKKELELVKVAAYDLYDIEEIDYE